MSLDTNRNHHAALVARMAESLGVNLAEEVMRGRLGKDELGQMLDRCVVCREFDACDIFLDTHAGFAEAAPGYCCNRDLLNSLARV